LNSCMRRARPAGRRRRRLHSSRSRRMAESPRPRYTGARRRPSLALSLSPIHGHAPLSSVAARNFLPVDCSIEYIACRGRGRRSIQMLRCVPLQWRLLASSPAGATDREAAPAPPRGQVTYYNTAARVCMAGVTAGPPGVFFTDLSFLHR